MISYRDRSGGPHAELALWWRTFSISIEDLKFIIIISIWPNSHRLKRFFKSYKADWIIWNQQEKNFVFLSIWNITKTHTNKRWRFSMFHRSVSQEKNDYNTLWWIYDSDSFNILVTKLLCRCLFSSYWWLFIFSVTLWMSPASVTNINLAGKNFSSLY